MEGQTATNPQTGEKIIFRGGQWQPLNGGPARSGPISSGAKPVDPLRNAADARDQTRLDILIANEERRAADDARKAADEADKEKRQKAAMLSRFKDDARNIARLGKDANDNGGLGETGTSGSLSRAILPAGTAGYSLDADIQTFKAKNAFAGLSELAAQGIKLTPISNEEIKLAAASVANLDPNADHATFMRAVDQTKQYYYDAIARIDPLEAYQTALENGEDAQAIIAIAQRNGGPMPDPEFLQKAVDYTKQGGNPNPNTFQPPETPPDDGGGLGQALYAGVGDIAQGVGDVLGLVGNPLNAGINALTGTNLSTDLGQTFRDATGAPQGDPMASAINRGGTAALTMAGAAGAARPFVQGAARTVTNALAAQPAQQLVGGATAGAAAEGAKQAGLPLPAQIGAGLLGGVLGFGGVNALMSAGRPSTVSPVAQAAQRQGVEMLPADVGGATTRRLTAAAAQAPLSAAPITAAAERSSASFGQATQRATQGSRLAPDDAGAIVVKAGERFNKQSRETGGRLYDRAEKLAQGVSIKAKGAIATIDEQIAELSQAREVNAPLINALERFKADLSNNQGIKVSGMRDLRTAAQKAAYTEDMRSTPAQRVLGIVANAISDDINAGLAQAGRANAAQAFKTADSYWRDRVEYIDKVLEPVIGKGKSGEAVLTSVEQMAQGKGKGVQNLMKLMRSVDKEELADIQATVIDRMGKSTAGAQNAEGSAYSASTFLTNWNKMSGKGKAALFPNTEVRRNLDELAMIADNMKQAGKYANSSNTAGGIMGQVAITGGLGMASPTALILGSAAQYLSGRALTSPRLTAWLAKVPTNPQAQAAHIKRLDAIAAAEPIIANDIASIKQFLANAPSSSRAAATEGEQVGEERPIQP